ncbi:hypothetical protein OIU84_007022 [Salix udensis]|uniref:Uncharacterized protein n=1 Tax=Salix udensis TaxID=889485 RepID=A0AAD6K1Z6_9ROSI|nr:hypothetical protein OIU84_007022 [Salix udensis]
MLIFCFSITVIYGKDMRELLPLLFCPSPSPSKGKKTKLNELDKSLYLL